MPKSKTCLCGETSDICTPCQQEIDQLCCQVRKAISDQVLDMDRVGMSKKEITNIVRRDVNTYMELIFECLDED